MLPLRCQNNTYRRFKPPQFTDETIKKHWDPNKSALANMQSIGLLSHVNSKPTTTTTIDEPEQPQSSATTTTKEIVELFDIPESDSLVKNQKKLPLGTNDQIYIAKCMTKHGDDYHAMARDIKLNEMQHTEHQLRKMGARFLLLNKQQRRVHVPEKVQHLVLEKE